MGDRKKIPGWFVTEEKAEFAGLKRGRSGVLSGPSLACMAILQDGGKELNIEDPGILM